jgi:hypothetical protein
VQKWTKLYHDAMAESNATKPWLLDDAIDAVLDQIEDTFTRPNNQQGDLTRALNELRSRRREVHSLENRRTGGQSNHRAA